MNYKKSHINNIVSRLIWIEWKYLILFFLIFTFFNSFSRQLSNIDSLIIQLKKNNSNINANAYADISVYYLNLDSFQLALKHANKAERMASIEKNDSLALSYFVKGFVYMKFGSYVKAMDNFSIGEQIAYRYNDYNKLLNIKYGKGLVYEELREYQKSIIILNEGLEIANKHGTLEDKAIFYSAIGTTLQDSGNFEASLIYLNKYFQVSVLRNDTLDMIYALINIGESKRKQKKYSEAISYYNKAQSLNKYLNKTEANAAILGNIALIHSSLNNYNQAIKYFTDCINLSIKNQGLASYVLQDYKNLADVYFRKKDYNNAYYYYDKYVNYSDSISEVDYMAEINRLNYVHKFEEYETKEKILEQKLIRRTIFIYFSSILGILIILLAIITLSRYKLKAEKLKTEVNQLNLELDKKNRELVSSLIDLSIQTETKNDIKSILIVLNDEKDISLLKQHLLKLSSKLANIDKSNNVWESFKFHFEEVHPDFFTKLQSICNKLTTNDLRFCAYIKLNLSTQEIANILSISIKSTQATRLRIKNKLNIPKKDKLENIIQSL